MTLQQEQQVGRRFARAQAGMTLIEVVVAISISGLAVAGIVSGYVFSVRSGEKSALSLAANARAMERLESALARAEQRRKSASGLSESEKTGLLRRKLFGVLAE